LVYYEISKTRRGKGYTNVIFNGIPTILVATTIAAIVMDFPDLHGLYNLGGQTISKYRLLKNIAEYMALPEPIPADTPVSDKSLCFEKLAIDTGYSGFTLEDEISFLCEDYLDYPDWSNT
jgi:dTDP-4-dehydrorhamnose reductase